jgi:hypothetical protein
VIYFYFKVTKTGVKVCCVTEHDNHNAFIFSLSLLSDQMAVRTNECGHLPELMDQLSTITPVKMVDNVGRSELVEFKKSLSESDSFHGAFSRVIIVAQCFGLMPVCGITGPSASFTR